MSISFSYYFYIICTLVLFICGYFIVYLLSHDKPDIWGLTGQIFIVQQKLCAGYFRIVCEVILMSNQSRPE